VSVRTGFPHRERTNPHPGRQLAHPQAPQKPPDRARVAAALQIGRRGPLDARDQRLLVERDRRRVRGCWPQVDFLRHLVS
jgi:hypothetical protein